MAKLAIKELYTLATKAYNLGFTSAKEGKPITSNPFITGPVEDENFLAYIEFQKGHDHYWSFDGSIRSHIARLYPEENIPPRPLTTEE
jgi:hypothetical protein